MQHPILRAAATALTLTALAPAALADEPAKQPPDNSTVRLVVKPGETIRWRSPNIGPVRSLYVRINGGPASYNIVPGTRRCAAYIYGQGAAVRLTDCDKGRRVPYVRVRAVSAALEPVVVRLRLN